MAYSGFGSMIRWMAMVAGLILIVAGCFLVFQLRQFQSRIDDLKDAGYPISFAHLQHEAADPEQDLLTWVRRTRPQLETFHAGIHATQTQADGFFAVARFSDEFLAEFDRLCTEECPELFPMIEKASRCTDMSVRNSPVINGSIQGSRDDLTFAISDLSTMARALLIRSRVLAFRGQAEEAVECGLQAMRLGRIASQRVDGVVNLAEIWGISGFGMIMICDVISKQPVSDRTREQINEEIERLDVFAADETSLRAERASIIEHLADHGIRHVVINGNSVLDQFESLEKVSGLEFYEFDFVAPDSRWWKSGPFVSQTMSVWAEYRRDSLARQISWLRALRIINALTANRDSLTRPEIDRAYLVSIGVPEAMTVDTVTGKTMLVRHINDRWVVYSPGFDGTDDEGAFGVDLGLGWSSDAG